MTGAAACVAAACTDPTSLSVPSGSPPTTEVADDPAFATGLWVFHVGGPLARHVQLFEIRPQNPKDSLLRLLPLATRDWVGREVKDFVSQAAFGTVDGQSVSWTLRLASGATANLRYQVLGETALGTLVELVGQDSVVSVRLVGFRVQPPVWLGAGTYPALAVDGPPVVLLRMDDSPPNDRDFIHRLIQRSLYAELAVPTLGVGQFGRPGWDELRAWVDSGFSVAAHSRRHGAPSSSPVEMMDEVVGSLQDLADQQLPTPVFVQPGTWSDSAYFDSPVRFRNWRGALFRTFTRDMEAYAWPVSVAMPLGDSLRLGLGHYTITQKPADWIQEWWGQALSARRFTVFLVHTADLRTPDELDWFLDSLATAAQAGRIRLAHSSAQLFSP